MVSQKILILILIFLINKICIKKFEHGEKKLAKTAEGSPLLVLIMGKTRMTTSQILKI